ncbi:recombination regulator RecX [Photobacterium galatheae]|uniref:Regulatory protein RecX n=1 Tax=Photobacterium galatheae TaxID=1654360 RepID=A0A066RU23_9GAMM|nr:recombination regulator RecX [Photobacterium galatheae]KDM92606.1 RecX family transcriptional regulator [Photobacterium galatheae]MCM0149475.1 recombination regulator RecX [Photobacterium galatheae]
MRRQAPKISAKEAAVGYLSRRDHAERELQRKLKQRGYSDPEVSEAIAYCQDYNWLDDARYAAMAIRSGLAKGWGKLRIQQEMKMKGVHELCIRQALDEADVDWYEQAKSVAQRKFGDAPMETPKEKARRLRFMQSRGFDFDQIRYALSVDDEY